MAKILVIDDDPDLREMLRFLLAQANHEVLQAVDGLDGLRQAWQKQPDVILLDVMMPTLDGYETLRRLKSLPETRDIPVIVLTAVSAASRVQSLIACGAADYVVKPFAPHLLLERVEKALARERALSAEAVAGAEAARAEAPCFVVLAPETLEVRLLLRYLMRYGQAILVHNDLEAWAAVAEHRPRAVLLWASAPQAEVVVARLRAQEAVREVYLVGLLGRGASARERAELLGSGFDAVLEVPATRQELAKLMESLGQPRISFARLHGGIVVLVVVALERAAAMQRLRDAILDFRAAGFRRFVLDLSYIPGGSQVLPAVLPLLRYLIGEGVEACVVTGEPAAPSGLMAEWGVPVFGALEEAFAAMER
jgi:DNA-binding response OmpR family regulator